MNGCVLVKKREKMLRFLYKIITSASENLFAGTSFAMQIYPYEYSGWELVEALLE